MRMSGCDDFDSSKRKDENMKFLIWKGYSIQPFVSLWTLVITILVIGNYTGEYTLPLLIFLAFQLLYMLKKGAFLAGRKLHVMARNSLTVIILVILLLEQLKLFAFPKDWWLAVLSILGILVGFAIMGGKER